LNPDQTYGCQRICAKDWTAHSEINLSARMLQSDQKMTDVRDLVWHNMTYIIQEEER